MSFFHGFLAIECKKAEFFGCRKNFRVGKEYFLKFEFGCFFVINIERGENY